MTVSVSSDPVAGIIAPGRRQSLPTRVVGNPARFAESVGRVVLADDVTVDRVVATAHSALPLWSRLSARDRADHVLRAAQAVGVGADARARLLTGEQGKVLWESELDLSGAAPLLRYYASLADEIDHEDRHDDSRGITIVRRRAIGVTALIVPWNYPVYLCLMGLAPALMAGNPVVVKPSELAPLALTATLELIAAALPPGVLTVIQGDGAAGSALVRHPLVRKVLFTGGNATGRAVLRDASDHITSVSLELGGNDPAIVLDSARIDDTLLREIRRSVFTCTGQVCFNIKRIYVQRSRYDDFVAGFRDAVDEITVGDGMDPRSTIGPLNNAKQFDAVRALTESTRRAGATVEVLGRAVEGTDWSSGYFMLPAIVTDLDARAPLVAREQFGPIVPIIPFDDVDQAVSMSNDSEFGLAASVWSSLPEDAIDIARRIEAGSVFVNSHRVGSSDQTMPFGGVKQSGLGRNHGMWAIDECSELQAIAHRPDTSAFPGRP